MKHLVFIFTAVILTVLSAVAGICRTSAFPCSERPEHSTVRAEMKVIHERLGVNFVYDSSLQIDIPCMAVNPADNLEASLAALFNGTGISYEIMKKYVVLTKEGSRKKPKDYTIFIEEQTDTLEESRITAIINRKRNETQTGLEHIDASQMRRGFAALSSPDALKILQGLAGVTGGTELMNGLYVHGGTGNDNLYMYDGIPQYSVSHLGGLFSAFNTDMMEGMDFYKSGFPARFGGRLSSVVDVTSRDGSMTDYKGSFTIGLINGSAQFEGPIVKNRTSFNVGIRRSWLDMLTVPGFAIYANATDDGIYEDVKVRYAMTDFNAKVTHRISDGDVLRFGLVTGHDLLTYRMKEKYRPDIYIVNDEDYSLRWGNLLGYGDWHHRFSDRLDADIKLYYTQFRSKISWDRNESKNESQHQFRQEEKWLTGVYDVGLKGDFDHRLNAVHRLRYGADLMLHVYAPELEWNTLAIAGGEEGERSEGSERQTYTGSEISLYAEDEMRISEWFSANAGFRAVLFGVKGKTWFRFEPRLALSFRTGEWASFKLSYTEMNQYSHRLSTAYLDLPSCFWMPSTKDVAPMLSRQFAAGAYLTFPFSLRLDVEGFYKTMYHIREYNGFRMFPPIHGWEKHFPEGKGRSYGLETSLVYNTVKTHASVNYTLSWSERLFPQMYPTWFPDRLDHRHRVNVSASRRFGKRFEMHMGWCWHTGNRITVESHTTDGYGKVYSSPNNAELPDYHRLDVGFNFHKTTRRGNESIWNLSIYNVYCRMNPIYAYTYDKQKIMTIGIIPIIPTFSYTLRF